MQHVNLPHQFQPLLPLLSKVIILLISSVLVMTSCQQDELKPQVIDDINPKYETYYKLRTFYEKVEKLPQTKPGLLPRSPYSVQDVVDYVEGTLNLVYADPSLTWASIERSVDTFSIPLASGYADEEDVEELFENARNTASTFFYGITETDKFPFLFDVVVLVSSTSSQLDISVYTRIGKVHRDLSPFDEYDYWDIFPSKNTCDPDDDDDPPYANASKVMSDALNLYFRPYGCYFYTDETVANSQSTELDPPLSEYGWGGDNPMEVSGDWIMDFKTFRTECNKTTSECLALINNGAYCLAPDEMNYYFASIVAIYQAYANAIGLDFMSSDISLYEPPDNTYDRKSWECNDMYGTVNYCDEGSEFPFFLPQCC